MSGGEAAARAGWRAAIAIGKLAEDVAALPVPGETARAILRALAEVLGTRGDDGRPPAGGHGPRRLFSREPRFAREAPVQPWATNAAGRARPPEAPRSSTRARVAARPPTVFSERARDAADAFCDAGAAEAVFPLLAALVEGIKVVDDIQDEEPVCLASEIGIDRALQSAVEAFAIALELTAALPLADDSWRAATVAIGRGLRETATGQELEAAAVITGFHTFWEIVDRKTAPLLATALELGALAASAAPPHAAALTRLAVPMGRLLQIGDDCNDALAPDAPDWRTPHRNLLMLYALSGPNGAELSALLENGRDPGALHEAQLILLREGALAYVIHAQLTALDSFSQLLDSLPIPTPAPFLDYLAVRRADSERLLLRTGVDGEIAGRVCGVH